MIPGLDTFAHIWRAELNGIVKEPNDNARVTSKQYVLCTFLNLTLVSCVVHNSTISIFFVVIRPSSAPGFVKVHWIYFSEFLLSQGYVQFIRTQYRLGEEMSQSIDNLGHPLICFLEFNNINK